MKTIGIIKPDAVKNGAIGYVIQMAEICGFEIHCMRWIWMNETQAGAFYLEHEGKEFYPKLVKFMSSGPSVVLALELKEDRENTIAAWRSLMKHIREVEASKEYSERNAVHGSDSQASAMKEYEFFFGGASLDDCWDCGAPGPHHCPNSEG